MDKRNFKIESRYWRLFFARVQKQQRPFMCMNCYWAYPVFNSFTLLTNRNEEFSYHFNGCDMELRRQRSARQRRIFYIPIKSCNAKEIALLIYLNLSIVLAFQYSHGNMVFSSLQAIHYTNRCEPMQSMDSYEIKRSYNWELHWIVNWKFQIVKVCCSAVYVNVSYPIGSSNQCKIHNIKIFDMFAGDKLSCK